MNTKHLSGFLFAGILSLTVAQAQSEPPLILISQEQVNTQTGAATSVVTEYAFYAEANNVTATAVSLTVNGGAPLALSSGEAGSWKYSVLNTTPSQSAIESAFPGDGTYVVGVTNGGTTAVSITGPGANTFAAYRPITPLFTFAGVTGTWSVDGSGHGVFTYDPNSIATSFTVTINTYSATTSGGNIGYFMSVADVANGYNSVGEAGAGPVADNAFSAPTFTFTKGLAADAGDADELTYGFVSGSSYQLEAGFYNVIGLADSELTGTTDQKAFIYGNSTSFTLQAIPEPATYTFVAGFLALAGACLRRRRVRR